MIKAGASTSLYGILGACFGYFLINWPALSIIGPVLKFRTITILLLMLIFLILFGDQASKVDYAAHFSSLLAGFFLAGILQSIH